MSSDRDVTECPECGAGVKALSGPDQELSLSELTESDTRRRGIFCPMCEIACDAEERSPYNLSMISSRPSNFLTEITALLNSGC